MPASLLAPYFFQADAVPRNVFNIPLGDVCAAVIHKDSPAEPHQNHCCQHTNGHTHTHRVKEARPYIRKVWKTENEERKNVQIEYRAGRGEGKDRREPRQQTRRPRTMHRSMTVTRRTLTTEKAVADADAGPPVMAVS